MKTALALLLAFPLLAAAEAQGDGAARAPAQTAPQPQEQPAAAPRAPLKLRLDDATPARPNVIYTPRERSSEHAVNSLPGLGGKPSKTWERSVTDTVPKDSLPGY